MNVTCPNCKEIYSIQIDLFREKNQQLECVNCGHQWDQNLSNKEIQKAEKVTQKIHFQKFVRESD